MHEAGLPALVAAVIGAAPPGTPGSAGGLLNAVRQTGATFGVALMGAVASAGMGWPLLLSGGMCALAWLVFALTRGNATDATDRAGRTTNTGRAPSGRD
ncbi:hypothetical protein [Streptomyces sp. KAU_LT]|uniref:hypothetical protein n=1 Tax=Streptomyces sp. KAU_LT TaxID=3046669 RepID=UPI0024B8249F|nr:hypothetical protein [Streptomyces sp. KAU_LT]MDI9835080.1 hypothetical protein [Streptomyces sp. KAU_LT]